MMALCHGAALHLLRHEQVLAGDTLIEATARHAITHATLPPAVLAGLPEAANLDSLSRVRIRTISSGSMGRRRWPSI